ncbi:MAG TPA: hypothetical protein EYQ50_21365 [Verrucomicrobiales bacterium]|nr:hypothetical protein [Verrucomicrobiales bacterium]HIL68662.1 hypothetical protein [Verrucomicrobiota bacterium]
MLPFQKQVLSGSDQNQRRFLKDPTRENLEPIAREHSGVVYGISYQLLGSSETTAEATGLVFRILQMRARSLPKKKSLTPWLFQMTLIVSKQLKREKSETHSHTDSQSRLTMTEDSQRECTDLFNALTRITPQQRDSILLKFVWRIDGRDLAKTLRISETKAKRRADKGLTRLAFIIRKRKLNLDPDAIVRRLSRIADDGQMPDDLWEVIKSNSTEIPDNRRESKNIRAALRSLCWIGWKCRLKILGNLFKAGVALLLTIIALTIWFWQSGSMIPWMLESSSRKLVEEIPELAESPKPWEIQETAQDLPHKAIISSNDLYQTDLIRRAHFEFTKDQWAGLEPRHIQPINPFRLSDQMVLRNPNSTRGGLAGVLGLEFDWVHGNFEWLGRRFENIAVRYRGNGTYIGSLYRLKRSFKLDLNKYVSGQKLVGLDTFKLNNLIEDSSYMHDSLGYELFREMGVPAPRTSYVWLTIGVEGKWERRPFGLYLLIENIDSDFAEHQFGHKSTPIFKPITYDLFGYLGRNWEDYRIVYDLKTEATESQKERLIEFARIVSFASDKEFSRRIDDYLDLDKCAGFLAGTVLQSNFDGILSTGQNFYLYLDPRTNKFGLIPWDLDHSWGEFGLAGTAEIREQASIRRPWTQKNRFLERIMGVERFRKLYQDKLRSALDTHFHPHRLYSRIDELAKIIRNPIAAESSFRLRRFEQAISDVWLKGPRDGEPIGPKRPVHQLKRFISNRADSVRKQLDGKTEGIILNFKLGQN